MLHVGFKLIKDPYEMKVSIILEKDKHDCIIN